jgi:hypothetical protein
VDAIGYRAKAAEMRRRADEARDTVVRQELHKLAAEYERLAGRCRRPPRKAETPPALRPVAPSGPAP